MSEWISIKDKMPEDIVAPGTKMITVLICTKANRVSIASRLLVPAYLLDDWKSAHVRNKYEWSRNRGKDVMYWMPLPKPPLNVPENRL